MKSLNNKIKTIIDESVNPSLAAHKGFVILAGVEIGPPIEVILEFHGACSGCPASHTFTLKTIEHHLREELNSEDLIVINADLT